MQTSKEHFTTMADAKFDRGRGGLGANRVYYGELENRESLPLFFLQLFVLIISSSM